MLPVAAAKDAAKARELTGVMIENLREIMNICTRLVMDATSLHLKLDQMYPAKSLAGCRGGIAGRAEAGAEFQIQLPKYGGGVLTFSHRLTAHGAIPKSAQWSTLCPCRAVRLKIAFGKRR